MTWTLTALASDPVAELQLWRELLARGASRHPLLDSDYVALALTHLARGRSLHWLQYSAGGQAAVVGLVEPHGYGRWSSWHLPQLPVTTVLVAPPGPGAVTAVAGLFAALPAPAWQLKLFDVDPAYVGLPAVLGDLPQLAIATHQTVAIDPGTDFACYWDNRSRDLQRNVARCIRKLAAAVGPPQLRRIDAARDMSRAVAEHAELELSGWKGQRGTALRADDLLGVFYRAVLERYAALGAARVYQLHAGSQLVASQLCIVANGILVTMKTTYHGNHVSCSPGRILDYLMLQQLSGDPAVKRCEFCVHADKSDRLWATELRATQQVEYYRGTLLRHLAARGRRVWRQLRGRRGAAASAA
jgi:Acetyltransferase (GNAT) domain